LASIAYARPLIIVFGLNGFFDFIPATPTPPLAWCDRNRLLADRLLQRPPRLRWHFPASLAMKSGTVLPPRSI
jgi:hypothetical protein